MKEADADIYLQSGAGDETGMVAAGCRFKFSPRKQFGFIVAHDMDCHRPIYAGRYSAQTMVYRYGIRRADLITSQTQTQQKNLQACDGTCRRSVVRCVEPRKRQASCGGAAYANQVLWVGRIVEEKRPHWVRSKWPSRCPDITFHIAGSANKHLGICRQSFGGCQSQSRT